MKIHSRRSSIWVDYFAYYRILQYLGPQLQQACRLQEKSRAIVFNVSNGTRLI